MLRRVLCFLFWLLLATYSSRAFQYVARPTFACFHNDYANGIYTASSSSSSLRLWATRGSYTKQTTRKQPALSSEANTPNSGQERTVVIMYHKPANVITSHSNSDEIAKSQTEKSRRTVYENICSMQGFVSDQPKGDDKSSSNYYNNFESATNIRSKLHAIGRLDADTTGLLLLTNDGNLIHQVTNPTAKQDNCEGNNGPVKKTYQAVIMGHHELPAATASSSPPSPKNTTYPLLTLLKEGVTLSKKHGGQTKPVDDLKIISYPTATTTLVSITISEGKNRQIRRMFHSVGSGVMKLHRVSVGKLTLSGLDSNPKTELQEGEWRVLSEDEIRLGLGWKCRWIDKVQTDRSRSARINSGKRQINTRKNTRRRNKT